MPFTESRESMSTAEPHAASVLTPLGGVVAVGNFDGVHLGHQRMIEQLVALAQRLGTRPFAMTFDPPPLAILAPGRVPPQLTTLAAKIALLKDCGVADVIVCPTSPELLELSAEEFFEQILIRQHHCRGIVEGPNFRFGRGRQGDIPLLRTLCDKHQIPLSIVEAREIDGRMISSSEVRSAIRNGHVRVARQLLGRPYSIAGMVGHGAERGRLLGFPTANLIETETLLPPLGVYAGRATVDGEKYPVALNIGPNPTFGENSLKIEAHLVGYSGQLYDRTLSVELLDHLRGVVKFSGIEALKEQLQIDIAKSVQCEAAPD